MTDADVWVKVKAEREYRFGNWDGEYFSLTKKTIEHPYTRPAWVPKPLVDPYTNSPHLKVVETYEGEGDPRDKGKSDDSSQSSQADLISGRPSDDDTVKELEAWLDDEGVEYKSSWNKPELLETAQDYYDEQFSE